jgi:hypothetical protein
MFNQQSGNGHKTVSYSGKDIAASLARLTGRGVPSRGLQRPQHNLQSGAASVSFIYTLADVSTDTVLVFDSLFLIRRRKYVEQADR